MSIAASSQSLTIPSVTEHDLQAFRSNHFGQQLIPDANLIGDEDYDEQNEDDGLGYYADGVKRTLTDEQIAMFRHSEIQTFLRERRIQQELEDDQSEGIDDGELDEAAPPLSNEKVRPSTNGRSTSSDSAKRKWAEYIDESGRNPSLLTHRRLARELDELKAVSLDIDYGDDAPQPSKPVKHSHASSAQEKKPISYADDDMTFTPRDAPSGHTARTKFQWPVISAPRSDMPA